MLNLIEIRNEEWMGSRRSGYWGRQTVTSAPGQGRVGPAVRGFGGQDGRDGGALLAGAAALVRRPVPAGRDPPVRPRPDRADPPRTGAAPPPAPIPPQAPHRRPIASEPAGQGRGAAAPWQSLYFLPEPQGQGWLRPTFLPVWRWGWAAAPRSSASVTSEESWVGWALGIWRRSSSSSTTWMEALKT